MTSTFAFLRKSDSMPQELRVSREAYKLLLVTTYYQVYENEQVWKRVFRKVKSLFAHPPNVYEL